MAPIRHVVVDGSNIATEGRSIPSLAQLESALDEIRHDFPDAEVTVVVDATFAHRIDESERAHFEELSLSGKMVSPPAGAIGRGDAFLLRIAEKVNGTVLSNDSFQEFHGEHPWLFEEGRLLGATPVPGVGWILSPRTPVRGLRSRVSVREADRAKGRVEKAIAVATAEVTEADGSADATSRRRRRRASPAASAPVEENGVAPSRPQAVNAPAIFIGFIAEHPLGKEVNGVVEGFTSHGAVVRVGEVECYVPLSGLASPAPRSAREILKKGEERTFVVTALDPFRRGVELALPGVGVVRGTPSEETVAGEVALTRRRTAPTRAKPAEVPSSAESAPPAKRRGRRAAVAVIEPTQSVQPVESAQLAESGQPTESARPTGSAQPAEPAEPAETVQGIEITRTGEPVRRSPARRAAEKAAAAKTTRTATPRKAASASTPVPVEETRPAKRAAPAKKAVAARKRAPAEATAPEELPASEELPAPAKRSRTSNGVATSESAAGPRRRQAARTAPPAPPSPDSAPTPTGEPRRRRRSG